MQHSKIIHVNAALIAESALAGVTVQGWVRTRRDAKGFSFLELNDGSSLANLQVIVDESSPAFGQMEGVQNGAAVQVEGDLVPSPGKGQKWELRAFGLTLFGEADQESYPLQKKRHSDEFLRSIAHLRPRTNKYGAAFRLRSEIAFAVHSFFHGAGFYNVHTPILTGADCEGAGEMFRVTTLPLGYVAGGELRASSAGAGFTGAGIIASGGGVNAGAGCSNAAGAAGVNANAAANPASSAGASSAGASSAGASSAPASSASQNAYSADFFGHEANLTVSGQLNAEALATALGRVYSFGPTFRAENSNTPRHAAEFWMIEPEAAFFDLEDNMKLGEDLVRHVAKHVLERCSADLELFNSFVDATLLERIQQLAGGDYARVSYREAIEILRASGKKFDYPVSFGLDLQTEHERFLAEEHFKGPVTVYDYPKAIKAFYMRGNDDGETVAAMDMLVPRIGELIGGSQREERLDVLEARIRELGQDPASYWWYLDLRRFGSVPHSGFGLGFERLIMLLTGISNIRDVIAFPRTPGSLEF